MFGTKVPSMSSVLCVDWGGQALFEHTYKDGGAAC
jgi:hypothetical protein